MKPMVMVSRAVLCGLVLAACATDPAATDDQSVSVDKDAAYEVVHVPPELTLAPGEAVINGNEATVNACHVKLLFCADPRTKPPFDPPLPSYCSNGCTASQAFSAAQSLCRSICGHIDCSVLANFGSC